MNIATAFDCPFEGRVPEARTIALLERLIPMRPDVEICLCDTTARAEPTHVESLFEICMTRFLAVRAWAFHAHDTSTGRECACTMSGLGGCPFAPGATGNVATEDVVWMFEREALLARPDACAPVS